MKKLFFLFIALMLFASPAYSAVTKVKAAEPSGDDILPKVIFLNQGDDQLFNVKMKLIDSRGSINVRGLRFWTRGETKRLIKFLSPADIKGVGFLVIDSDLPSEKMYLYMPAFKKVKRIAGSAKGESFMESDFSYNDIGASRYEDDYTALRLPDEKGIYVLDLKKKSGSDKDYDKIKMWVGKESMVPVRAEFYKALVGEKNKMELRKVLLCEMVDKVGGYFIPMRISMEDARKKHKTVLELSDVNFNNGLKDEVFTERNLQK